MISHKISIITAFLLVNFLNAMQPIMLIGEGGLMPDSEHILIGDCIEFKDLTAPLIKVKGCTVSLENIRADYADIKSNSMAVVQNFYVGEILTLKAFHSVVINSVIKNLIVEANHYKSQLVTLKDCVINGDIYFKGIGSKTLQLALDRKTMINGKLNGNIKLLKNK